MKCKKAIIALTILFLLLVGAIPTVCVFMPYQEPKINLEIVENQDTGETFLHGTIENPTVVDYTSITIIAYGFDEEFTQYYPVSVKFGEIKAGKTISIEKHPIYFPAEVTQYLISDFDYEYYYTTLSPYVFYMIGIGAWFVAVFFFQRKKLTFEIGNHKVEVLAGMTKLKIAIDGKIYKEAKVKTRFETIEAKYKVSGQILNVQFKAGNLFPSPTITVDGVQPKFTKIQQHSFLKIKEKTKEDIETIVQG